MPGISRTAIDKKGGGKQMCNQTKRRGKKCFSVDLVGSKCFYDEF